METITFYSYKGGTGRTLLVAHTARYLALSGKRVVAVDLDLEAPGLHYRLATDAPVQAGVVNYLLASLELRRAPTAPLGDYLLPVAVPDGTDGQLWLLPAGPAPSGDYWKQLTRLLHLAPFLDADGAGLAAILDLKARIEDELQPDCLLLDARTGITEVGGVATSVLADKVVCLMVDNQESLDGTRAVIEGLRRAQRPSRQAPVEVFPVLSRVTGDVETSRKRTLANLNGGAESGETTPEVYVIRDDPGVETDLAQQSLAVLPQGAYRDYRFLLAALVPVGPSGVSPAWARHVAVQDLVEWLTTSGGGGRYRRREPNGFHDKRVEEGLLVGEPNGRYADLVAYADDGHTEPLLAAEYVGDDLDASTEWAWWQAHTELRCVILFNESGQRVLTRGRHGGAFVDRGEGWGVQWPASFTALDDPGDHSVPSMLDAVRRGAEVFVPFLVERWQHATWFGLHGGFEPNPPLAKEILDGLASVKNDEWMVLHHTSPGDVDRFHGGMRDEGALFEEHTTRELHAPLWWRLSAKAKVGGRPFRHRTTPAGVELLASEIMGLAFDQDREYRGLAAQLGSDARRLRHAYDELKFVISDEPPPELLRRASIDPEGPRFPDDIYEGKEARAQAKADFVAGPSLDRLLRDAGGKVDVVTTNLLGNYDPVLCSVVLYRPIAAWCASAIDADQRALENVVLLHETVHALCHLGLDLDGNRWDEFVLPSSAYPTFRPSTFHEGVAQYFTVRMLERLDDDSMTDAFKRLSAVQPPEYQAWQRMRSVPLEAVREALLQARAGLTRSLAPLVGLAELD